MTAALALLIAFAADRAWGDPPRLPHHVVYIGRAIARLEAVLRRWFPATPRGEFAAGCLLVAVICGGTFCLARLLLGALAALSPALAFAAACFLGFQTLAATSLARAARDVYAPLARGDLAAARTAVGRIVGRDTARLDARGITRAAVETVAENASDGVVAPLFYFALGGAPLALLYKAVNTLDSMIGYRNDRYRHFGRAAARLDDAANLIPARLTALFLIAAAWILGFNWRAAWRVYVRDRAKHASPNAAHPEAACAGALGVALGGASVYGGAAVRKPTLGDDTRDIEPEDILRAADLMRTAAWLALAAFAAARPALFPGGGGAAWN